MRYKIDRKFFYDSVRESLFNGIISQSQVDGMNALFDVFEKHYHPSTSPADSVLVIQWLAYCFSTAYHETAYTMKPIEEYGKGQGYSYGVPSEETGETYYGRGYVQLTWDYNYQNAGDRIGEDLYWHPELALEHEHAARIIFQGMKEGWFTGKKLGDYINEEVCDYYNARRIVNGTDKASTLQGYAEKFEAALRWEDRGRWE